MKKVNSICELATKALLSSEKEDFQYVSSQKAVIMEVCYFFGGEFELRVVDLRKGFDYKKEVVKVFSDRDRIDASNWLAEYYGDC